MAEVLRLMMEATKTADEEKRREILEKIKAIENETCPALVP